MSRKAGKQSTLRKHLQHPLPGVRIMAGPEGQKRSVVLGRPGVWSRALSNAEAENNKPAKPENESLQEPQTPSIATETLQEGSNSIEMLWLEGLSAFEEGEPTTAADYWSRALIHDPNCADAMLGLHLLDPSRDDLLRRMYDSITQFGDMRQHHDKRLASTYRPAGFMIEHLELEDDLRRALAIYEHRQGNEARANRLLEESRPCTLTSAVWARIAFENGEFKRCLSICQKLERDDEIAADIDLMSGCALISLELAEPAIEMLQRAILGAPELEAELHARYYLGIAFEKLDRNDEARQQFEAIYALDMSFADVAQRLSLHDSNVITDVDDVEDQQLIGAPELDLEWRALVEALSDGELATDPSIPDNQG